MPELPLYSEKKIGNGLENIIQRIYFISLNGILRHICNKNNNYICIKLADFFRCLHSVEKSHLDVKNNKIVAGCIIGYNVLSVLKFRKKISSGFLFHNCSDISSTLPGQALSSSTIAILIIIIPHPFRNISQTETPIRLLHCSINRIAYFCSFS